MKRLVALLLTMMMVLTLAACGGKEEDKAPANDDKTPSSSEQKEQQEDKTPEADPVEDEPEDKGGNETDADGWPVADYITAGMKYTGAGKIVDASTWKQDDTIVVWRVYFDVASVDEVAAYIDALKADGFTYWPLFDDEEEQAAGTFSTFGYEWQAEIANGPYVEIQHYEEPTDEFSGVDLAQLKIVLYSENPNA